MKAPITLRNEGTITITRDPNGVPVASAQTEADLYYAQGYIQAMDRGMQLLLTRILGQGRAGELLDSSDEMLNVDIFFRRMNWYGDASRVAAGIAPAVRPLGEAFCEGINAYFAEKVPWEMKFIGYRPEPWRLEDAVLLSRMIGYINLQQSQAEIERLLVEMVQAGVDQERLEEIFPDGGLKGLDRDMVRKVRLLDRVVPEEVQWGNLLPRMISSNNWVVSGKKTAGGKPILANDPHLEVNRLPNVWQEIVLKMPDRFVAGACLPGLPGVLIGRNKNLSWGATYSFMDAVDSWVEECRGGKFKRKSLLKTEWVRFKERRETIKRKKKPNYSMVFFENEHGVLEGDPFKEGFYLTTRWASGAGTGAQSLESIFGMLHARDVKSGMDLMGRQEMSFNWVFADASGNIGYQMSGLLPRRRSGISGLVPMAGWDAKNDWKGFASPAQLPRRYNPGEGFLVTANNDLNALGKANPINTPMGSYRADRIRALLKAGEKQPEKMDVEYMKKIQYDVHSVQAEAFMEILRPLLPEGETADLLGAWNCSYDRESQGAVLFERFYRDLFAEVFGSLDLGPEVVDHLFNRTGIITDFYNNFDRILLASRSAWFGERSREEIYRAALEKTLTANGGKKSALKRWGAENRVLLSHMMLGGKFPKFMGFDRGPIALAGGRATPCQGQIYQSGNRTTSFAASFRMVADMSEEGLHVNLCGGPSDRRFSRLYASHVPGWIRGDYRLLEPGALPPVPSPDSETDSEAS